VRHNPPTRRRIALTLFRTRSCNSVFFTFVGVTVPWSAFNDPALGLTYGNLTLLCVGVLFLRRVPAMMLFYRAIPQIADSGEALFMGWMAPIGAGSIFYTFVSYVLGLSRSLLTRPAQLILEEFKAESENADDLRIRA
jgi:NhaP-type Na+/H+ or K+/H+ antiporter